MKKEDKINDIVDELISIECDIDTIEWYLRDENIQVSCEQLLEIESKIAKQRVKLYNLVNNK